MRTVPADLARRYEAAGYWTRDTVGDLLARGIATAPDTLFQVHSDLRPWAGTFRDVDHLARRLAAGLRTRGVGAGDVIAFQLPNWVEAAVTFWAAAYLGAVIVPVVHFYGRKEVGYILGSVRPTVFIGTGKFGRLEFQPDLPAAAGVRIVGVVGRDFAELLADEPMEGQLAADPAAPALIAFTSGTTRDPKGVIHSHQTLGFETRQLAALYPADRGHQLTSAPVGHFIGMLNAFLIPVLDGMPINLSDVWDPAKAMRLMDSHGLTIGGGAVIYMTSILDHPDFTADRVKHMKYAGLGGAPVPVAVTTRLESLGITVFRSYGSTEQPSITGCHHTAPLDKRLHTDGPVLPGVEMKLAEDGEILSRGPDLCLGYTDEELTRKAFDDEGWYHTGDIGVLDSDGYLSITDRKSDVIIRGGENISAQEVEELLLRMDGVAEVAVVAAPDARLGEHAAAVVRMRPGHEARVPALDAIRAHLEQAGLARQKWPEEVRAVEEFPRTASGKVQKFVLRKSLRED
jgi:acyl-CoA synthetase (AMP-forming)/AMP-acid ligase II